MDGENQLFLVFMAFSRSVPLSGLFSGLVARREDVNLSTCNADCVIHVILLCGTTICGPSSAIACQL
jgi:hypothetical protein